MSEATRRNAMVNGPKIGQLGEPSGDPEKKALETPMADSMAQDADLPHPFDTGLAKLEAAVDAFEKAPGDPLGLASRKSGYIIRTYGYPGNYGLRGHGKGEADVIVELLDKLGLTAGLNQEERDEMREAYSEHEAALELKDLADRAIAAINMAINPEKYGDDFVLELGQMYEEGSFVMYWRKEDYKEDMDRKEGPGNVCVSIDSMGSAVIENHRGKSHYIQLSQDVEMLKDGMTYWQREALNHGFSVVIEDPGYFEDMDDDDPEPEVDEPQEDDCTIGEDEHRVYQSGKLWVEVPKDAELFERDLAIVRQQVADQYWPNVWSISDHGNAHLMDMSRAWAGAFGGATPEGVLEELRALGFSNSDGLNSCGAKVKDGILCFENTQTGREDKIELHRVQSDGEVLYRHAAFSVKTIDLLLHPVIKEICWQNPDLGVALAIDKFLGSAGDEPFDSPKYMKKFGHGDTSVEAGVLYFGKEGQTAFYYTVKDGDNVAFVGVGKARFDDTLWQSWEGRPASPDQDKCLLKAVSNALKNITPREVYNHLLWLKTDDKITSAPVSSPGAEGGLSERCRRYSESYKKAGFELAKLAI
jgi:hypothetical protein